MFQRMTDFARWICPAALALALMVLFASPAAVAQSDSGAQTARRMALEKRVLDIVDMFMKDSRFNRGKTADQIKDGVEFVTGNVLFVLAHETGHGLISAFEIPVAGREEDAADQLATVMALKMADSFADRVLVNAARGWFLGDQRDRKAGVPTVFYDEHGMDLQRAYHIVCLLVGGAPDKFRDLADEVKLPKGRQDTCKFDFSNAEWSWGELLKPHLRKPGDPKTNIKVTYVPSDEFATLGALGQKLQILETVAEWLSEDFVWKTPISLEMRECGGPNARWIPGPKKIEICYELIREFVQLHRGFGQAELVPGTLRMSKNKKIVLMPKRSTGKSGGGKSFRSERAER
jgi:Putative metallopeptidase